MEIKSISQKIFRAKSNSVESNSNQTNPFGVNYKGNMINADVFFCGKEKAAEGIAKRALNRVNKLTDAWKVGAMGSFSEMSNRFNAVGRKIKATAMQARKILTKKREMPEWVIGIDSVKAIKRREMPEIKEMFRDLVDERVRLNKEVAYA